MGDIRKEIGQYIRTLRRRRGMTQEDMADLCGLHWTYIGGLERGERNPTLLTLQKVAQGLKVDVRDLLLRKPLTQAQTNRDKKEGALLKILRRKEDAVVDLATRLVRDVVHWKDRYGAAAKKSR